MTHVVDGVDWSRCVRCPATRTDPPGTEFTNRPVAWDRPGCYAAPSAVG